MSKKAKATIVIVWILTVLVLMAVFKGLPEKGTIVKFVDDAVIVASENGKKVTLIEDYRTYIPTGEQWSVGDKVKIRDGLFSELSIRRLA